MKIHFEIIGILLMLLALAHVFFPKYFNWKEEQKSLSLINKQMMTIHIFFIALGIFLMGALCFNSAKQLIETDLGKTISLGLGVFWVLRLVIQWFGYSTDLWKGKAFETVVHMGFTVLWIYLSTVFLLNYIID